MANGDAADFEVTRCSSCNALDFGAAAVCRVCGSEKLAVVTVPGTGVLDSWTVIRRAPVRFMSEAPYTVGVVDLDAGLRVTARIAGDASRLRHGDAMQCLAQSEGGCVFERVGERRR